MLQPGWVPLFHSKILSQFPEKGLGKSRAASLPGYKLVHTGCEKPTALPSPVTGSVPTSADLLPVWISIICPFTSLSVLTQPAQMCLWPGTACTAAGKALLCSPPRPFI